MNDLPDGIRGKILAVGLCFVVLAVFYTVIVSPLAGLYESGSQTLRERKELVQRLQVSAHELPRLRREAEEARANGGALLLTGSSATVAAATLQSTMKKLVESGGARLSSAEILSPENRDQYQRVGIHVQFGGDLRLLMSVLRGIETARPVMFIDNVEIRGAGADAADESGGNALSITLDLYGFRLL
jgi:general secretion pathway protein M